MSYEPHYINSYIILLSCLFLILYILLMCIEKVYGLFGEFKYSLYDSTSNNKYKRT